MKSLAGTRCVCLSILFALPTHATLADNPESAWQPLFNGSDLAGWQVVGEPSDCWAVSDGILHPTKKGGWLSTTKEYADFELELEFMLAPGSNSGVFLRAPHEGRTSRKGMEIQLIDEGAEMYAELKGWQRTGALYHVQEPTVDAFTAAEKWQTLRVRAEGRQLTIWLNDTKIVDANLDSYPERDEEHPGLKRPTGYIGLQNYGGRDIQFQNVRLRELD